MADPMRADAEALDGADELAHWRDEFFIADPNRCYLDGNSLGMLPKRTLKRLQHVVEDEWGTGLMGSWSHWVELPRQVGDQLAPLIGARAGEVIVHDSTTVNLYQLLHVGLGLRPDRRVVCIDQDDFPTDRYVVDGVAASLGHTVRGDVDDLTDVAVVVRSAVDYRTGAVTDIAAETARADRAGAVTIWDLSHAAGVLAVDLTAAGAQLAVGCTYKYLNAGPGAPAFSFVTTGLHDRLDQPIWGWFGAGDMFEMSAAYAPRVDIGRLLLGTPGILALAAASEGIELTARAGIEAVAAKAAALTGFALSCCDARNLESPTPREAARRGGHVSVAHPAARRLVPELAARGVITDFRAPDLVRLGCSPLSTRFTDVWDGVSLLADLAG